MSCIFLTPKVFPAGNDPGRIVWIFLIFLFLSSCSKEEKKGLALTPPMGWNSWNAFQGNINETKIKATADIMVSSGMRDAAMNSSYWMTAGWQKNATAVGKPGGKIIPGSSPVPLEKYTVTRAGTTWLSELYYIMKTPGTFARRRFK